MKLLVLQVDLEYYFKSQSLSSKQNQKTETFGLKGLRLTENIETEARILFSHKNKFKKSAKCRKNPNAAPVNQMTRVA